jgi:hypothetical protein
MDHRRSVLLSFAATLALAAVAGCSHYWSKSDGTKEMFWQDSRECARAAAANPTAAAHGIVDEQRYRACLSARGWVREKQIDPPPPGWYRGIE